MTDWRLNASFQTLPNSWINLILGLSIGEDFVIIKLASF